MWEDEEAEVPDWLSGTYVRNGPAQLSFSSSKRVLTSWLDGFAKLHSFKETILSISELRIVVNSGDEIDK